MVLLAYSVPPYKTEKLYESFRNKCFELKQLQSYIGAIDITKIKVVSVGKITLLLI